MKKKILTIEQLIAFCKEKHFYDFDSNKYGYKLAVGIPSELKFDGEDKQTLYAKVKVCHTLLNRNGSYISEEDMKKAMPSIQNYIPLLGTIHKLDSDEYDFHEHDVDFYIDEDGNEQVEYIEKQIGTFTTDEPYLEYDEEKGKTYVIAKVAIPVTYTKAANIIKRKGGTKISCELEIEKMAYNAKEKRLELIDFIFTGATCLGAEKDGTPIGEGMEGARLDIENFSAKENSIFSQSNLNEELFKTLKDIQGALLDFNKKSSKKGGQKEVKFEELLKKYNKQAENVEFEIEGLSDEELEAKFVEVFGEPESSAFTDGDDTDGATEGGAGESGTDNGEGTGEPDHDEPEPVVDDDEKKNKYSKLENGNAEIRFEVSFDEITEALYNLIGQFDEIDNEWYGINAVYDDHFVMQGWWNASNLYGCKYTKDNDVIALDGERYKLYSEYLTESEKLELDSMRSNYALLSEKVKSFESIEKEEVLKDESYEAYLDKEVFKELSKNMDKYTVEEFKEKAELAFAKCVKEDGAFSLKKNNQRQFKNPMSKVKKESPYGNLFD